MTEHIYRVLEVIGSEKPMINIIINDLDVSLYMNGFKVIKYNNDLDVEHLNQTYVYNFRIASLYMITQRLKIFLLTNFDL